MAVRGSAALTYLARYPFLPGGEELLGSAGSPSLSELVTGEHLYDARESSKRSIEQSAVDPSSPDPKTEDAATLLPSSRYLAFQYSRILLAMPGVPRALERRWCLHVAKDAWNTLGARAVRQGADAEAKSRELCFIAERLGFTVVLSDPSQLSFSIPSYVRMAAPIREEAYRLAAQRGFGKGKVSVDLGRAARLLQEGVRLYLLSLPGLDLKPALIDLVKKREGEFLAHVTELTPLGGETRPQNFDPKLFPPCIREMQSVMARGENLSHFGRFTLAAFLHKVGASTEYMVDCYRGAPDFDEDVTRYQLEHITHHDDGKGYTPPECSTVLSNGLCFKERDDAVPGICIDPKLRHPLNYYSRRGRSGAVQASPGLKGPVDAGNLPSNKEVEKKDIKRTQ